MPSAHYSAVQTALHCQSQELAHWLHIKITLAPPCLSLEHHVLHCTALNCTALHCTALHCTALHCSALHCTALHCTALHCTALHCTALHCTAPHCTALLCSELLYYAFHYTVLYCGILHYNALQCTALFLPPHCNTLKLGHGCGGVKVQCSSSGKNTLEIWPAGTGLAWLQSS